MSVFMRFSTLENVSLYVNQTLQHRILNKLCWWNLIATWKGRGAVERVGGEGQKNSAVRRRGDYDSSFAGFVLDSPMIKMLFWLEWPVDQSQDDLSAEFTLQVGSRRGSTCSIATQTRPNATHPVLSLRSSRICCKHCFLQNYSKCWLVLLHIFYLCLFCWYCSIVVVAVFSLCSFCLLLMLK